MSVTSLNVGGGEQRLRRALANTVTELAGAYDVAEITVRAQPSLPCTATCHTRSLRAHCVPAEVTVNRADRRLVQAALAQREDLLQEDLQCVLVLPLGVLWGCHTVFMASRVLLNLFVIAGFALVLQINVLLRCSHERLQRRFAVAELAARTDDQQTQYANAQSRFVRVNATWEFARKQLRAARFVALWCDQE